MVKKCNRCGKGGLEWNKPYFEKSGKWRLQDHKNVKGEWCVRNNGSFEKTKIRTKKEVILCELCSESSFGLCKNEEDFRIHMEKFHPNGEIMTDLDYIAKFMTKHSIKTGFWQNDKHYSKYV